MFERLSALKHGGSFDFIANDSPKCPHCFEDFDISENEAWQLYEEERHEISCRRCDMPFTVISTAHWSFSTDDQEEAI